MINYDDTTGKTYENDWFNLTTFDETFEKEYFLRVKLQDQYLICLLEYVKRYTKHHF